MRGRGGRRWLAAGLKTKALGRFFLHAGIPRGGSDVHGGMHPGHNLDPRVKFKIIFGFIMEEDRLIIIIVCHGNHALPLHPGPQEDAEEGAWFR